MLEKQKIKLMAHLTENFENVSLIEQYENYFRFQVGSGAKLSKIFSILEGNKSLLEITYYSVQQTTIEQIFNNFVDKKSLDAWFSLRLDI